MWGAAPTFKMSTSVDIANFALGRLGAERILSLTQDTENAILANLHYEQTVRQVLRSHPWNCCKTRDTLTRLSDAPAFGYKYAYQLPIGFLRALTVNNANSEADHDKWKVEGETLLTDETSVQLVYVYYEEDATKYDALLVDALAVKLASKMAGPITGNPRVAQSLEEEYETITRRIAQRVDSSEDSSNENHPLMAHVARSPLAQRRYSSPLG